MLLRRAAEGGDLDAMLSLGKHYQYGDLVSVDELKARSLIVRAANLGSADAQFHLAALYLHGWCGCNPDDDAYLEWLDRAAASQHPEALFNKGRYLMSGCGSISLTYALASVDSGNASIRNSQRLLESS